MSTPRDTQAGVPQGSVLSPTLYNLYISDTPQTPDVYIDLFTDDICIYVRDRRKKSQRVSVLLRRGVSVRTLVIYLPHRLRPLEAHLTLSGRNIPFANHVKYLGVIFDKRITWRLHTEMTEVKAFRTFIRI
jgi:hypothetical protein